MAGVNAYTHRSAPGRSFTRTEFRRRFGYDPENPPGQPTKAERDSQAKIAQLEAEKAAMPVLAQFQGLETLGEKGVLKPQLIQGAEIQRQLEESPWYRMALQKQAAEEAQRVGAGARQAQTSIAQARAGLAARGGLRGGAAERLAGRAGENLMLTRQNILGQGALERSGLGMQGADLASRIAQQNMQAANAAEQFNIQARLADLGARENRAIREYEEKMKLRGGEASAKAQSSGDSGLCCFIFLEARYGNGTMDEVVRKYRNENMTERNRRGYYKLSEVLVPAMRKSKIVKFAVRTLMTDPMVSYGKWYYGKNKTGWIFKPIKDFWIKTFDYLGLDHEYIRENGEVV